MKLNHEFARISRIKKIKLVVIRGKKTYIGLTQLPKTGRRLTLIFADHKEKSA
jgi:hypothetical protein